MTISPQMEERMNFIATRAAEKAAKAAANEAVEQMLERMGIDPDDHLSTQRDFAYLRKLRTSSESVTAMAVLALVGVAVTALGGWILLGFKSWISGG